MKKLSGGTISRILWMALLSLMLTAATLYGVALMEMAITG